MMNPAWPKRIIFGQGWMTLSNGRQTCLSETKIGLRFQPATKAAENVAGSLVPRGISRHQPMLARTEPHPPFGAAGQ